MLGMTQLLQRASLPQAQQQQLDNLDRAGRLLRSLANDVLDFSKLDAHRVTLEHTVFALDQVIDDVRRMCQEDLHAKGLQLDCKVAPRSRPGSAAIPTASPRPCSTWCTTPSSSRPGGASASG
jgi:signal transduction histidine kinase